MINVALTAQCFQLIVFSPLSIATSKMPRYFCLPWCKGRKEGHLFPAFKEECDKYGELPFEAAILSQLETEFKHRNKDLVCSNDFFCSATMSKTAKKVLKAGSTPSPLGHCKTLAEKPRTRRLKQHSICDAKIELSSDLPHVNGLQ